MILFTKIFCLQEHGLNLTWDSAQIQLPAIHLQRQGRFSLSRVYIWTYAANGPHCGLSIVLWDLMWSQYTSDLDPPARYRVIDLDSLVNLMGCKDLSDLQTNHKRWVQATLDASDTSRQAQWTESIATGSKSFVEEVKKSLGEKARGKSITGNNEQYQLRENVA